MQSNEIKFGENLKNLRKSCGMKQSELAGRLGVDQRTVSAWEHGVCEPNLATLLEISRIFNEDLLDLIT